MSGLAGGPLLPALTIGEPLVAGVPTTPVPLDDAACVRLFPGGAELNVAVGLARLGVASAYLGVVGDDPLGRLVLRRLADEGVDASLVRRDPHPTGFYLREWLADGARRPYYYRRGAAGAQLSATDLPGALGGFSLVHLSGITPALGEGPRATVEAAVAAASAAGVPVSFDANWRPTLWSGEEYRACVQPLLGAFDLLLVGEEEADLLFATSEPGAAVERAGAAGVGTCVVRLGARGACARGDDGTMVERRAPATAVDPVGAGDAFDAGFLAAWLHRAPLGECLALGVFCGARVVEEVGEHEGAPRRGALPETLERLLGPTR